MKKLGPWLIAIVCISGFTGSCSGQLSHKSAPPKDGSHQTFSESFTGKEIQGWSTQTVNDKKCLISDAIEFPASDEVNHHKLVVKFKGEGTVEVSIAHSSSSKLTYALSKSYLHSSFKTVKSGGSTDIISSYKGERYIWIILRATGKTKIVSADYSCWWGKKTLYGHAGKVFEFAGGKLPYRLMAPKNYNPRKSYPLVLTVSGSGGVGNNNVKSMEMVGLARQLFIKYYNDEKHECFSLVSQVTTTKTVPAKWKNRGAADRIYHPSYPTVNENSWYTQATLALIQSLVMDLSCNVDPDRIYFSGFSLGGKACWEFLKAGREVFAAGIACGGWPIGMPYREPNRTQFARLKLEVTRYKHIPVQIFAGEGDNMKLPSKILNAIIISQGGKSTYTEFPKANHVSSANKTWANAKYIDWLFEQNRSKNPKPGKDPYPNGKYN